MPAPQPGNQGDNSTGIIWGIAAIFATLGGIWFAFKDQIVAMYLTLKLYEVQVLSYFNEAYFLSIQNKILLALKNPAAVSFPDLVTIGQGAGDFLRYPIVAVLIILSVVVYLGNTTRVFKRAYSMKDLAKLERENWPQITPVVGLDLIKDDIDKGAWAMAMTPMQFSKRYQLFEEVRTQRREGMTRRDWDKVDILLKRGEANKVFALQLGPLWPGVNRLPPHTRALFAAFAARINADTKAAAKVLAQLNLSSSSKRLNLTGVNELLKKHLNSKGVQRIINSHGYVLTVMAAMLEAAREDGVQASADFLWLKPLDRKLWYMLNTVGRQTPFVEVAGPFAHWVAEKEAGRKLIVPFVEEATKALEIALKEVLYRPEEVA